MNKTSRVILLIFLAFMVTLGFLAKNYVDPKYLNQQNVNKEVPNFNFFDITTDKIIHKNDLIGQKYILISYATWCGYCHKQHKLIEQLKQISKVKIYGVLWNDTIENGLAQIKNEVNPYDGNFIDKNNILTNSLELYGVPNLILIDETGKIKLHYMGSLTNALINNYILPILRDKK
ncbi:MAG: thioredoxin fold domain-containing protein [Sphingobacteriia bacterium]|nr:thioredoxin fold domain-containing protein [Sphingobacteriia bacterium]